MLVPQQVRGQCVTLHSTVLFPCQQQLKKLSSTVGNQQGSSDGRNANASKRYPLFKVNICRISSSNRLFVPDSKSGKHFLIDTGADVSVIPPKTINRDIKANNNHTLFAANGTAIHTYGTTRLTLNLGLRRPFTWISTIADTRIPIIGSHFLQHFYHLVDLKNSKLVDVETRLSCCGIFSQQSIAEIRTYNIHCEFFKLLEEFKDITQLNSSPPQATTANVTHCIETKGSPPFARPRRLTPEKFQAAKSEVQYLVNLGVCRASKSPYASPLHMVRKAIGECRPCGGYRALNAQTTPDRCPLPYIQDCTGFCLRLRR